MIEKKGLEQRSDASNLEKPSINNVVSGVLDILIFQIPFSLTFKLENIL